MVVSTRGKAIGFLGLLGYIALSIIGIDIINRIAPMLVWLYAICFVLVFIGGYLTVKGQPPQNRLNELLRIRKRVRTAWKCTGCGVEDITDWVEGLYVGFLAAGPCVTCRKTVQLWEVICPSFLDDPGKPSLIEWLFIDTSE